MIDLIKRSNFCLETIIISLTGKIAEFSGLISPPLSEFEQQTKIAL